ncbi:hypothetical protein [uncultured Nostoc sp.]
MILLLQSLYYQSPIAYPHRASDRFLEGVMLGLSGDEIAAILAQPEALMG